MDHPTPDDAPKPLWWLSFVDPELPVGSRSLGIAIVPATGMRDAVKVSWALGCNPGGEVAGVRLPNPPPPDAPIGTLVPPPECWELARRM